MTIWGYSDHIEDEYELSNDTPIRNVKQATDEGGAVVWMFEALIYKRWRPLHHNEDPRSSATNLVKA